jgi:hypothetical protein
LFAIVFDLEEVRQKLQAPLFAEEVASKGWLRAEVSKPFPGLTYMVMGVCELSGEIIRGAGVYEPEAGWMLRDTDTQEPRQAPGTGWSFLDPVLGITYPDKEIHYFKPFPRQYEGLRRYLWLTLAIT